MTQVAIESFLAASPMKRLRLARDPDNEPVVRAYLGEHAAADYLRLARRLTTGSSLAWDHPTNLIFIPGVMGSLLESRGKGGMWWLDLRNLRHIDDLGLAPDGGQDADPANGVRPFNIDLSYEPLLLAINARDDFGHEIFPYDWRKSLLHSAAAFRDLVVQTWNRNGRRPIHVVCHSMGGLMLRTALMLHGDELWPRLGKGVFIATPHYGAPAIAGYLKNHLWGWELLALLGRYLSRDTFRSLWGVLGLLPAPHSLYPGTRPGETPDWTEDPQDQYHHPCANFDLYRAAAWELDLTPAQTASLQQVLDGAADLYARLDTAHRALDAQQRRRMLVIAGVGYRTLFRIAYKHGFSWKFWTEMDKTTTRETGDRHREGDGRVPLASAQLEGVEARYVRGTHGGLPNLPDVYGDVFRWLKDEEPALPRTAEAALAGHLATGTRSDAPYLDTSFLAPAFGDDPGILDVNEPSDEHMAELQRRLEQGQLPEFATVRLL